MPFFLIKYRLLLIRPLSPITKLYNIADKKNDQTTQKSFTYPLLAGGYGKGHLDPQMHPNTAQNTVTDLEGVDEELLAKVLNNPEMAALLTSLAKTMK